MRSDLERLRNFVETGASGPFVLDLRVQIENLVAGARVSTFAEGRRAPPTMIFQLPG